MPDAPPNPWVELPKGRDVAMRPDYFYAAIASLDKSYDETKVQKAMRDRGLELLDWGEQDSRPELGVDPDHSHRFVAVMAHATRSTTIPWSPGFLWIHPFHVVRAWEAPPAPANVGPPAGPTPAHDVPLEPPPGEQPTAEDELPVPSGGSRRVVVVAAVGFDLLLLGIALRKRRR
jgi:hypothetical protein